MIASCEQTFCIYIPKKKQKRLIKTNITNYKKMSSGYSKTNSYKTKSYGAEMSEDILAYKLLKSANLSNKH